MKQALVLVALLVGCRATPGGSEAGKASSAPAPSASPAAASASSASAGDVAPVASSGSESKYPKIGDPDLPKLKPILEKPFPEGASEEVVCEAIENVAEKDLWARFGHIVPMYFFGTVLVLEAKGKTPAEVREFIRSHHYGRDSQTRFCGDTRALVYVRKLADDSEINGKIVGRETLVKQLTEDFSVRVRESYAFPDDQTRLSNYCRADAELCERLVKLDFANRGKGLCPSAMSALNILAGDRDFEVREQRCLALERSKLACVKFMGTGETRSQCRANLKRLLGLGE